MLTNIAAVFPTGVATLGEILHWWRWQRNARE
jgi:hypothetical protein